jgi:hypothetical protein
MFRQYADNEQGSALVLGMGGVVLGVGSLELATRARRVFDFFVGNAVGS